MPREELELVSEITEVEVIAVGSSIRDLESLRKQYGGTRWRKLKGKAYVVDEYNEVVWAEIHWYECYGVGRRQIKVKRKLK